MLGVAILLYRGLQPGVTVEMFDRPLLNGVLPIQFLFQAYATGIVILYVNALRTLGAHRFMNDGSEMTFSEQLIDSVNFVHWPLISGIWAPVGLRFHALHHLFPSLPYHQLAKAHAKLMQELPANNLYRRTNAIVCLVCCGVSGNRPKRRSNAIPNQSRNTLNQIAMKR